MPSRRTSQPEANTRRLADRPAAGRRRAGPGRSQLPAATSRPEPAATIALFFEPQDRLDLVDDPLREDLSTVAIVGRTLFTACDETATVERLVLGEDGAFHHVENIALGDFFDLPDGPDGEMDIEGLAIDRDDLWITGSHSLKRDKADLPADEAGAAMATLAGIERDPNRCFLGRLRLTAAGDGIWVVDPAAIGQGGDAAPACLKMKSNGRNTLKRLLEKDPHLGPAMAMPCKENGFDIEGIAARNGRVLLGLRGPVLRGWAVILELELKAKKPGRLKPRRLNDAGDRYLKHFLPLEGLGIRDLHFDGDDLLILAGPTMDHDGTGALYRWRRPLDADTHRLHDGDALERLLDLPYERGRDQAEGIAFLETDRGRRLLVVHDGPTEQRLVGGGRGILADLHDLAAGS